MTNLTAASAAHSQSLDYFSPVADGGDAVSSQGEGFNDSGWSSDGSVNSVKIREILTSSDPRRPPVAKQRVSVNGQPTIVAQAASESQESLRAAERNVERPAKGFNPFDEVDEPPKEKGFNPFDEVGAPPKETASTHTAPTPPRTTETPTPESLTASAINNITESSETTSTTSETAAITSETQFATLDELHRLRGKKDQKLHESQRTPDTANVGVAAAVSNTAFLPGDPLDAIHNKWMKLHRALNKNQPPVPPHSGTSSSVNTPLARNCGAFYDSLMRHVQHGSALSLHQVTKALRTLTLDAGAANHTEFHDTLRYTTLQPHLESARIEDLFRLARLCAFTDRSRAEITSTAHRQLIAALAKNKDAAKAAVPLADALLDAMGAECQRLIQQRWINNVEVAIAANRALKATPQADWKRQTARLVDALRELAIISQRVDFDQSARQRLRDLHTGLSARQAKRLDDMLGIGMEKSEHANATPFDQFLSVALPEYETDPGMQARMFTFIEQWRDARRETPTAPRRELDFPTIRKSAYHRSWAPVRVFSRLWQRLTGKTKQEPIRTRNEIKDLVADLTTGKPVRHELKGTDHLERIFQTLPPSASDEQIAERTEFKVYLQQTLRKLNPQEARALHQSLVKAKDPQAIESSDPREREWKRDLYPLGWAEALTAELERGLEREFHVRELVQCVTEIGSTLKMSRLTAARRHKRGEALIAAMDKLARTMAAAPEGAREDEQKAGARGNAFDLLKEAVARTVDFDGVRTNDRRIVERVVEDMDAVLGYKCQQWAQARNGTLYTLAHAGYLATK